MASLIQFLKPENQAQRAKDQALRYINDFPPIIVNGEDITCDIREALRLRIETSHTMIMQSIQARNAQFLGGLLAFFIEVRKAKTYFAAYVTEFQSETAKAKLAAFQRIEQELARSLPPEDAAKLLNSGRLSRDSKRVTDQIYRTALEASQVPSHVTQSQYIPPHNVQQRIWGKDDFEAFEESLNQELKANSGNRETTAQQASRAASPQGLPPPPRMMRNSKQVEAQDPVEISMNSGGSSGYEASSSGDSARDPYEVASSIDEDNLEGIDVDTMYSNVAEIFDAYHQDGTLENL
ncbi:hypothetical protein C0995_007165 [Termitomyces sp. Mi166|nr:hypothetical protein C0995_007165 [Termitomyces sp. Mi166\